MQQIKKLKGKYLNEIEQIRIFLKMQTITKSKIQIFKFISIGNFKNARLIY